MVEKLNKMNEAMFKTTTKLILPGPQLSDKELENIGKLNAMQLEHTLVDGTNPATKALVGTYDGFVIVIILIPQEITLSETQRQHQ